MARPILQMPGEERWGPFFRSADPQLPDVLDWTGGTGGEDSDAGSPADDSPEDEDRNRPGEYPESDSEDRDPDDTVEDEEEDWDEDEDSEEDLEDRPGRTWESLAKENRRRALKLERQNEELMARVLAREQPMPETPEPDPDPPHSTTEISEMMTEGRTVEALQAMERVQAWRDDRLRRSISRETQTAAKVQRLDSYIRQGLNLDGNRQFAQAVNEKVAEVRAEFPDLVPAQATLFAAALVGSEMSNGNGRKRDLRGESKRRQAGKKPPAARSKDRRARGTDSETTFSSAEMRQLRKFGDISDYVKPRKDPEAERRRIAKIRRLKARIAEVRGED